MRLAEFDKDFYFNSKEIKSLNEIRLRLNSNGSENTPSPGTGNIIQLQKFGPELNAIVKLKDLFRVSIYLDDATYRCTCSEDIDACEHLNVVISSCLDHIDFYETEESKSTFESGDDDVSSELVFMLNPNEPQLLVPYLKNADGEFVMVKEKSQLSLIKDKSAQKILKIFTKGNPEWSHLVEPSSRRKLAASGSDLTDFLFMTAENSIGFYTDKGKELKFGGVIHSYSFIHDSTQESSFRPGTEYKLFTYLYNPFSKEYETSGPQSKLKGNSILLPAHSQKNLNKVIPVSKSNQAMQPIIREYLDSLDGTEFLKRDDSAILEKDLEKENVSDKFFIVKSNINPGLIDYLDRIARLGLGSIYDMFEHIDVFLSPPLKEVINKSLHKEGPVISISIHAQEAPDEKSGILIHGKVDVAYADNKMHLNPKKWRGKSRKFSGDVLFTFPPERLTSRHNWDIIAYSREGSLVSRNLSKEKKLLKSVNIPFKFKKSNGEFQFTSRFLRKLVFEHLPTIEKQNIILRLHESLLPAIEATYQASFKIESSSGIDWFEGQIKIKGVESKELKNILKAYRAKKDAIQLSNGNWVFLNTLNLDSIMETMEKLGVHVDSTGKTKRFRKGELAALSTVNELTLRPENKVQVLMKNFDKFFNEPQDAEITLSPFLKKTLREYQKKGVSFFCRLFNMKLGGILADEMGLGKTLQALSFMDIHSPGRFLVIAPLAAIFVWEMEAQKFVPKLKVQIWHGLRRKEQEQLQNGLVLTTYATLSKDIEIFEKKDFKAILLDEAQSIKNIGAQSSQAVRRLNSESFFLLTGTPIENYISDLWSLMDIAFPGLLGTRQAFKKTYGSGQKLSNRDSLIKKISPFILRRRKEGLLKELPPKTETTIQIPMNEEQWELYEKVRHEAITELEKAGNNYLILMLPYLMKLRRICCHPDLKNKDIVDPMLSGKITYLSDKLSEIQESASGVLLFSQFTDVLKLAARFLEERGIEFFYLDGTTPLKTRKKIVQEFQDGKKLFFLISLKAGGTALTLHRADTVFHLDPWWNPSVENQATDRIHRIGQSRPVFVYKMIAQNTIEVKVLTLQEKKKQLFDSIFNGGENTGRVISKDELFELLK